MEVFGIEKTEFYTFPNDEISEQSKIYGISSQEEQLKLFSFLQILSNNPVYSVTNVNIYNNNTNITKKTEDNQNERNIITFETVAKRESLFNLTEQMIKSAINLYIPNKSSPIKWSFKTIPSYSSWTTRSGCALIKFFKKNSKFDVQTSISSTKTISSQLQLTEIESIAKVEVGPKIEILLSLLNRSLLNEVVFD